MEQVSISQAAKQDQRIIYVEPNDVFDKDVKNESGKSLTPKYEDFCISFNLIVETFRRFKNEIKHIDSKDKNESNKYSIQWNLTREEQLKQRTSILQGNRGKDGYINADGTLSDTGYDYNYLTTYYTDLSFDSYKKTEIEGLGVESVQISYESWYTPTIVIKFVDVRGSALWGREEAIHTDEKITAENVFGAFFTMPYPLFRLQVKGFLGRPVTYQLACSNFKGEFNAQTGNFEAVVTFIGYSWSLLTDIPFTYLIAAPYAPGKGFKYWNENVNKEEWRLWDGESSYLPPPKLYDFFTSIKKAISAEVVGATAEQKEQLTLISGEKKELNDIAKTIKNFIQKVENDVDKNVIKSLSPGNDENAQILLFNDSPFVSFKDETKTAYQEMMNSLSEYIGSDKYQNLPITKPNGWENEELPTISFLEKFIVDKGTNGKIINISVKEITSDVTVDKLQKLEFNDKNGKLNTEIATKIVEDVKNKNSDKIKNFCYLIDFGKTLQSAEKRINDNNQQENGIRKQIEQQLNTNIVELLGGRGKGFKPFIGNVFKVIFCHLETFCHMVLDCANDIYAQMKVNERTAKVLGLTNEDKKDFNQTDLYENDVKNNITPFPAIHNEGVKGKDGCGYINPNCNNIYGWVGDISSHKFLEEQLVYSLQEGIQFVTEQQELQQKGEKIVDFPILPSDFNDNVDVFGNAPVQTVSDIAGNLAIRLTNILGILCSSNVTNQTLIQTLGRLDAYNLYTKISSVTLFKSLFNDAINSNLLENIMYCNTDSQEANNYATENDGDNKKRYSFETAKQIKYNNKGRHPFFLKEENKNSSKWIHFYDKDKNGITPAVLSNFEFYHGGAGEKFFKYEYTADKPYFTPIITNNTIKCLHLCSSKTFINDNDENYTNRYMFNILTEDSEINSVKNRFSELSNGGLKVGEYNINDDLKPYLKQFIKLDVENKVGFFNNVYKMLSGNASKIGLNHEGFLSEDMKIINYNWWEKSNTVKVKNDGNFEITIDKGTPQDIALSELVIQEFKVKWKDDNIDYNLFGCPFYYEQKDDYVKALLFLHTFKYNYSKIINVFSSNKTNGATEEVPKAYLLLLGGLLWWKNGGYKNYKAFTETKEPSNDETFFVGKKGGLFFELLQVKPKNKYYVKITQFFGKLNDIDINIKNQLINTFKDFAEKDFKAIKETYELKKNDKTAKDFKNGGDFQTSVKNLYKTISDIIKKQNNVQAGKEINVNDGGLIYNAINSTFVMASGSYSCISLNLDNNGNKKSNCLIMLLDESNTEMQDSIKDLYFNTYIVTDNCYRRLDNNIAETNKEIVINNSSIQNYLKGFTDACKNILESETETVGGVVDESVSKDVYKNRDVSIAIYYYLKNLWDKWLCTASYEQYDVKYFFNENFIFTDSFYINTYNKLAINCETILKTYNELAMEGTLFHFLGNICKDHGCIFLPVPDYVGFNGKTQTEDIATMDDLFRPLPYSGLGKVENSNKFIIMYTHSPSSSVESKESDFPSDSYDIWSHGNATEVGKALFKAATDKGDENKPLATREGYNVPSFGISFAKQNNHIFKNFKVSMDNPVMTEQAIKAISNIMNKANSDGLRKVAFIGQDIFNVFTNYSYTITVDMIGNAQICPLMYFQLTNIPMWRGTYMIFKVTHNMIPGDMTTTITAMKMNKYALPFNTAFFTPVRNTTSNRDCEPNSVSSGGSSSTVTSGDVVGIVGDSYVVGLANFGKFVDKAKQNNITAKIKVEQGQGNVERDGYCRSSARADDTKGITNAINDGCTAIVIHLGINSAGGRVDTIQKNLANGVKLAQGKGVKVFLCIPTKWRNALDKNYDNLVTAIIGAIKETQCGKIDYRNLQGQFNFDSPGIHPAGNGYSLISNEIIKQLKAEGIKEYSTTTTYTGKVNITNPYMQLIFKDGFDKYYHNKNGWRPVNRQSRSECTAGPSTWYERAGKNNHGRMFITRNWWQKSDTPSASSATYSQTKEIFEGLGFELVWHGTSDDAYKLDKSILKPGDLSTLFCRYTSGKKSGLSTAHGAMWTGSEWRSDFIQNNLWVYGTGVGREREYSVCIWRHPLLQ